MPGILALTFVLASATAAPATEPDGAEIACLVQNMIYEGRGETALGQLAIADVTLNRVSSAGFPDTVCAVVYQGDGSTCQFSWTCDGVQKPERMARSRWDAQVLLACRAILHRNRAVGPDVLWYHARHLTPAWSGRYQETARIGSHVFYAAPRSAAPEEPAAADATLAASAIICRELLAGRYRLSPALFFRRGM